MQNADSNGGGKDGDNSGGAAVAAPRGAMASQVAPVFADAAVPSRSLCKLLLGSTLREDMKANKLVLAGWLQSAQWKACRALARRHKVIVIDAEHGAITLDQVALCLEVMAANGCVGIVRVPFDLDRRKAIGILFPNVQSAAEARELIQNCYYPRNEKAPAAGAGDVLGTRGFGYGGCNEDGAKFAEYAAVANQKVVIGVQLENRAAFTEDSLDGILSTDGLCFTQDGPYDHSGSYGVPGQTADPRVMRDLELYRRKCSEHAVTAGKHVVVATEDAVREAVEAGYSFVALGTELLHVMNEAGSVLDSAHNALARANTRAQEAP